MSNLRTGGQVIADHLAANDVEYVAGIPGHGCLPMVDAFVGLEKPTFLQVRHEQSAAHLADAYFRVARKPMAVMTSIGPGAVNTAVGIATAYVDSSSMLVFTGDVHTYMFGRGVLQEVDRKAWADLSTLFEPVTKRLWQVTRVDQLARIMPQAYALAAGGRPGPVLISVPMDVQADAADVPEARPVELPEPPAPAASAVLAHPNGAGRCQAPGPPRRRRRRTERRLRTVPPDRGAPGPASGGHLPGQGRAARGPPALRPLSRLQGHRHRQRALPRGRRHPRGRLPLRRRGGVLATCPA